MPKQLRLVDCKETAFRLNVSEQYVRSLVDQGLIEATKVGNTWAISEDSLNKYIKKNKRACFVPDHDRVSTQLPKVVALSFFSGAMGLDLGMKNGGIEALLACEFIKACRETIYTNNPNIGLIGDINRYDSKTILSMAKIPAGRKVDIIFGGPPCQAFSTAGQRRAFNDERGNVFLRYLQIAKEIAPTYIVIENVRGLLSAPFPYGNSTEPVKGGAFRIVLDRLTEMGYSVSFNLYNAANFGAPQVRERMVIIAKKGKKRVPYLVPTNSENGAFGLAPWVTMGEAVEGIEGIVQHFVSFPEKRLKYFRMLSEGQYWKNLPLNVQKEAMGRSFELGGGKTGFYRRTTFSKPSPTLVTSPTMPATDLCHPTEDRPLSVEEYKAIQGFPLNWKICGKIEDQYKQIGNAVPIRLGEAIAKTILDDMNGVNQDSNQKFKGFEYSRYKNTSDSNWKIQKIKGEKTDDLVQLSLFDAEKDLM
jgi:DNA (cytosine-5)-methyltransferase 1